MPVRRATSDKPRLSLLLVEDDSDTREMYTMWLEHVGFTVFQASDADAGFLQALDRQPRVVITDYMLRKGPTGVELCSRLKRDPRTAKIPILLMTGSGERRTAESAIKAGCAVVRLKPYLPDELLADIEALIRGERVEPFPSEHG